MNFNVAGPPGELRPQLQSVRYSGSKLHAKGVLLSIDGLPANQVRI